MQTEGFSLRRSLSLCSFYRHSIVRWIGYGSVIVVACYISCALSAGLSKFFMMLYAIMSVVCGLFVSLSPLVFNHRDDTLMAQVPVTPMEKMAFYMGLTLISFPLLFTSEWYLICFVGGCFLPVGNLSFWSFDVLIEMAGPVYSPYPKALVYINGIIQTAFSVILSLWIVFHTRRARRTMRLILIFFGLYFCIGLLSGIIGFCIGFHDGFYEMSNDPERMAEEFSTWLYPTMIAINITWLVVATILIRSIYRKFKMA
ncbi:MAG: hypothetical protein NC039_00135 [Muribaculaceae bacterium]|nr:hypothetical protein [Muribaculaceae bacterium]